MKVRTTQRPDVEIDVDDGEYAQLKTMGLLVEEDDEPGDTQPKDTHKVRTTLQPDVELDVDEGEFAQLESMGLLAEEGQHYESATVPNVGSLEDEQLPPSEAYEELAEAATSEKEGD